MKISHEQFQRMIADPHDVKHQINCFAQGYARGVLDSMQQPHKKTAYKNVFRIGLEVAKKKLAALVGEDYIKELERKSTI